MLLLAITLTVAIGGLAAMEFGQARGARDYVVWSDDVERRLLRVDSGARQRW